MKKKYFILLSIFLLICISIVLINLKYKYIKDSFKQKLLYENKVVNTNGALIKLSNGEIIQLAGAYIPLGGSNYKEYLLKNIKDLIVSKVVKVEIISKPKNAYPNYPIVILYFEDGTNINEKLIKEGSAFFDHGYYPHRKHFEELEKLARNDKIGIWGSDNPPKVLFITSKYWQGIHLKDSPVAESVPEKDKIEYYAMPQQMWRGRFWDYDAEYGKQHKPSAEDFIDYYYKWYSDIYKPK